MTASCLRFFAQLMLLVAVLANSSHWAMAQPPAATQPPATQTQPTREQQARGGRSAGAFNAPEDIAYRKVNINSEGTRMSGETFAPKSAGDARLPTIVMSHGWGGVASSLRTDAVAFARAGYFVLTFDYRGWGQSDSRVFLTSPQPGHPTGGKFTAEVQEVRMVVDPIDMTTDIFNALCWVWGEPQCDQNKIGVWGSSYSGGHVLYVAARDPRVKAFVSQVGAIDSRWVIETPEAREQTFTTASKRTHGEIGYPEPGLRELPGLTGAPIREKLMQYAPVEDALRASQCAMLFIIAEKEELFDNKEHAIKAHALAREPKKLVTVPNATHYDIYGRDHDQARKLAIEWYDEHLKKAK